MPTSQNVVAIDPRNPVEVALAGIPYKFGARERTAPAGGAGVYGFVGIRPGKNTLVQVKQIGLNNNAAAAIRVQLRLHRADQIAAYVLVASRLESWYGPAGLATALMETERVRGNHTSTAAALSEVRTLDIPANSQMTWDLPGDGFWLWGGDPSGQPVLALWETTGNKEISATFFVYEWPVPFNIADSGSLMR